jgi:hypothetical protein
VTLGNTPNTDILCSNREGSKFVHIQVKTFVPGSKTVSVGRKAERDFGSNFVWALAGIPTPGMNSPFDYYVIPSKEVSKHVSAQHHKWLNTPGKKGDAHKDSNVRTIHLPPYKTAYSDWDISRYKNDWSIIERLLE